MPCLLDLPEEILEIIVFLISTPESSTGGAGRPVALLPVLSVHTVLHRIGVFLLYRTLTLADCETAYLLCRTLNAAPHYAQHVRALYAGAIYPSLPFILRKVALAQTPIDILSLVLNAPPSTQSAVYAQKHTSELSPWSQDSSTLDFAVARALASMLLQLKPGPREFVISRNGPPLPRDRGRLQWLDATIAQTLPVWESLHSIAIAYRLPGDSIIPIGLAHAPHLERIRTPLPGAWNEALLIASGNPALKRLAVTVTHIKARSRAEPVYVPVPGRVKESWSSAFPASAATAHSVAYPPSAATPNGPGDLRLSLADRLRAPVEVVSPLGTFHDKTERFLATEERPLSRKQVLQDGQGGISEWLIEARKHPRLLELLLAESDAAENRDLQTIITG